MLKKEKKKKRGRPYSENKVAHYTIHFRPTSQIKEFLDQQENSSVTIREALELLMKKRNNINLLLDELGLKYPLNWRRINRRNAQFITQKIRRMKSGNKRS